MNQVKAPPDMESLGQELAETMARDRERASEVIERVRGRIRDHRWQAWWLTKMEELPVYEDATRYAPATC
jgi:hypothetical protein